MPQVNPIIDKIAKIHESGMVPNGMYIHPSFGPEMKVFFKFDDGTTEEVEMTFNSQNYTMYWEQAKAYFHSKFPNTKIGPPSE